MKILTVVILLLLLGCARTYHVQIMNLGSGNVVIDVKADVPKTISTDAIMDVVP